MNDFHFFSQEATLRDVSSDNFANGNITFEINNSNYERFIPKDTYFKIRVKLSRTDDTILDTLSNISPIQFLGDNLWQEIKIEINGVLVESINDYYTQIAVLKSRMYKPYLHRELYGGSLNMEQCKFNDRQSHFITGNDLDLFETRFPSNQQVRITHNLDLDAGTLGYQVGTHQYYIDPANEVINISRNAGAALPPTDLLFPTGSFIRIENDELKINDHDDVVKPVTTRSLLTLRVLRSAALNGDDHQVEVEFGGNVLETMAKNITNANLHRSTNNLLAYINGGVGDFGNLEGVNTKFINDFSPGDKIVVNKIEYKVIKIISDTKMVINTTHKDEALTGDFQRISKIKADTILINKLIKKEIIWKPKLAFFDIDQPLPPCKIKITLTPNNNSIYQALAVESLNANKIAGTDFKFNVEQIRLYPHMTRRKDKAKSATFQIMKMRPYTQTVTLNSLSQYTFDIHKNSKSIIIFYQDADTNSINTLYSKSKFKIRDNQDLNLQRLSIQYNNEVLPVDQPDFSFVIDDLNGGTDFSTKWYYDTLALSKGNRDETIEPIEVYQKCGGYYYFKTPNNKSNAQELIVSNQFSSPFINNKKPQLFVVVEYPCKLSFICDENGNTRDVMISDDYTN